MYDGTFPYVLGVLMAWITWYPARSLDVKSERWFFTVIITIVAFGFIGFPLQAGDPRGIAYELGALVAIAVLIAMSWKVALVLLPVVWFAHGAWDLMYLVGQVPVDKPRWVVELCVPYDWLLGGYLMTRVRTWSRVRRGNTSPSKGLDGG